MDLLKMARIAGGFEMRIKNARVSVITDKKF
jgi:hypothetical protein